LFYEELSFGRRTANFWELLCSETVQVPYHNFKWTVSLLPELPDRSRTILFDELLDYFLEVWIPCAKAPREPVSAALGNFFASRYHVELASLARRTDSFNV